MIFEKSQNGELITLNYIVKFSLANKKKFDAVNQFTSIPIPELRTNGTEKELGTPIWETVKN